MIVLSLTGCSRQAHLSAEEKYRDARAKFERGELNEAFEAAESGAQSYAKRDPSRAYQFRVLTAEILVWQGKSKDALSLLNEEVPHALSTEDVAIRRKIVQATSSYYLQKFDDADRFLTEANRLASQNHPELLSEVNLSRAALAIMKSDYQTATRHLQSALNISREHNQLFVQASVLGTMGVVNMRQQHYDEAIDSETLAMPIALKLRNQALATKLSANLGWCYYMMGDFERALASFTEAVDASAKIGLIKDQILWNNNIGLIYYEKHDYDSAESYYKKSFGIASQLENRSAAAVALNNLATISLATNRYDSAERYNDEALKIKRAIGDKSSELYSLANQGRIAAGRKQSRQAEELFKRVINSAVDDASLRWEAETNLAGMYSEIGKTAQADAQYRKALSTIDTARAALLKEEHRLSFLTTATRFYNDYIDFLVSHGRSREALAVAEHSRARTLAEGLKVPVSQLGGAFHPEQNARKLNSVVLSYWLKPERSYLWVVTPTRVELYPLAGQPEIDAAVQDYRKALLGPRDVKDTANASGQKLYQMLVAPAQKLLPSASPCPTSAAVSKCGNTAPRVIVIGDGSLLSVNFETLLVPTPQPHYWIEDATIANASSIALLGSGTNVAMSSSGPGRDGKFQHVGNPRSLPNHQNLLLIGDPTYAGTEYPQLTQAKLEVQKVESYFPEQSRVVIQGKNATPSAYADTKPFQYNFIHFVAHGTASRVSPLDSSIVLSKEGNAYKLYARDIMSQPLKAQLVTISACYGAGNRAYSGEGLVGLSWAFLRAGAHNVIAALWEVNDASTPQLMDNLYLNIQNGQDPATALRAAKLDMLHSENVFRRPFYWGAFQLYIGS